MAVSLEQLTAAAAPQPVEIQFQFDPAVEQRSAVIKELTNSSHQQRYQRLQTFQENVERFTQAVGVRPTAARRIPPEAFVAELAAQADALATPPQRLHVLSQIGDYFPGIVKQIEPNLLHNQKASRRNTVTQAA